MKKTLSTFWLKERLFWIIWRRSIPRNDFPVKIQDSRVHLSLCTKTRIWFCKKLGAVKHSRKINTHTQTHRLMYTQTYLDSVALLQGTQISLNNTKCFRYSSLYFCIGSPIPHAETWSTYRELVSGRSGWGKNWTALKEVNFTPNCFELATALETSCNSLCSPVYGET